MKIEERKRYTWSELVEQYPNLWVVVEDFEKDGVSLISGVLIGVCTDNEIDDFVVDCYKKKMAIRYARTTSMPYCRPLSLYDEAGNHVHLVVY